MGNERIKAEIKRDKVALALKIVQSPIGERVAAKNSRRIESSERSLQPF